MTVTKPSLVVLRDPMPLVDCYGRVEREVAAAYITLACRRNGDTFRPVSLREIGEAVRASADNENCSWLRNPFCVPNFAELVKHGYAELLGDEPDQTIRLTDLGLSRLEKYTVSESVHADQNPSPKTPGSAG